MYVLLVFNWDYRQISFLIKKLQVTNFWIAYCMVHSNFFRYIACCLTNCLAPIIVLLCLLKTIGMMIDQIFYPEHTVFLLQFCSVPVIRCQCKILCWLIWWHVWKFIFYLYLIHNFLTNYLSLPWTEKGCSCWWEARASEDPSPQHDHCPWDDRKHCWCLQWQDLQPGWDQAWDDWPLSRRVLHLLQAGQAR